MKCVNNDVLEVLDIYNPANREFSLTLREKYNDEFKRRVYGVNKLNILKTN
jgi:hypothetical protein